MTLRTVTICLLLGVVAVALYMLIRQPLGAFVEWGRAYYIVNGLSPALVVVGCMLLAALAPAFRLPCLAGCILTAGGVIASFLTSSSVGLSLDFGAGGTPLWLLGVMGGGVVLCLSACLLCLAKVMDENPRSRGPVLGAFILVLLGFFLVVSLAERTPAIEPLIRSLERGPDEDRNTALKLFTRLPEERARKGLLRLLSSNDPSLRAMSALALAQANAHSDAFVPLTNALLAEKEEEPMGEMVSALLATTRLGGDRERRIAMGVFSLMLSDTMPEKRLAGIRGLRDLGGRDVLDRLVDGLEDGVLSVEMAAYRALKQVAGRDLGRNPREWREWLEQ